MQKIVRARVCEDRRLLELPEPVPEAAGPEVEVALTGLPDRRPVALEAAPPTPAVWPDMEVLGPHPLGRREIYEDV